MTRQPYSQKVVTAVTGRDVETLLRELYLDKRHSQQEIAAALGVSRSTVADWLRDFGISRDDRPAVEITTTTTEGIPA